MEVGFRFLYDKQVSAPGMPSSQQEVQRGQFGQARGYGCQRHFHPVLIKKQLGILWRDPVYIPMEDMLFQKRKCRVSYLALYRSLNNNNILSQKCG